MGQAQSDVALEEGRIIQKPSIKDSQPPSMEDLIAGSLTLSLSLLIFFSIVYHALHLSVCKKMTW